MRIIVYGTLRRGQCREHIVEKLRQAGESQLVELQGLKMFDLGAFPGVLITNDPNDKIVAEIIDGNFSAVQENALTRQLDFIEGIQLDKEGNHVGLYKRVMWLTSEGPALIYVFNRPMTGKHKVVVDWVKYCEEKEKKMVAGA